MLADGGKRGEKPGASEAPASATPRRRTYGVEVRDALIQLWEVADRVCSKRLRPMVPVLLPALERHGRVVLDDATRAKLLAVRCCQHRPPAGRGAPGGWRRAAPSGGVRLGGAAERAGADVQRLG